MQVMSSRDFNQDVSRAKRAARLGPLFITDRGRPTHVLMSIEAFREATGQTESVIDLLAMPDPADVDLDAARPGEAWDRGVG
jgi:hypothetical protein